MNKKFNKLLTAAVIVSMMAPTMVFAKGHVSTKSPKNQPPRVSQKSQRDSEQLKKQQQEAQRKTAADLKKAQIQKFKTQIAAMHDQIKQDVQAINTAKQQVAQKTATVQSDIAQLTAKQVTYTADQLSQIVTLQSQLFADNMAVAGVQDPQFQDVKGDEDQDSEFNHAIASMTSVVNKFQARLTSIQKVNTDLDSLISMLSQGQPVIAPAPAPDPSTGDASTVTTNPSTSANDSTSLDTNTDGSTTDIVTP